MSRKIVAFVAAGVLSLAGLTACSDDSKTSSGEIDPGGESSTSEASPTEPTTTEPTTPAPPDPGGITVEVPDYARLVAPKGWKLNKTNANIIGANEIKTLSDVSFNVTFTDPTDGAGGIDAWIKTAIKAAGAGGITDIKTLDPVTIDGVENYHLVGAFSSIDTVHLYGAAVGGSFIGLQFTLTSAYTKKEAQEIMDSVLPTVEYLVD